MIAHSPDRGREWATVPPMVRANVRSTAERCPSRVGGLPVWLEQSIRYSAVGLFNTALDAALFLVFTHWLGLGGLQVLAKGISYATGTVNSFYWNRSWTFKSTTGVGAAFLPYILCSLVALAINTGSMYASLQIFDQHEFPALCLATGITLLWNFAVSKFLVFRK